ncbi:type IV/VI secretion system protein, DotU family [Variovorax sp. SRS16]|uniref:DotU family type IV/VI secretion system protein n=1 Tax=Variovorax sp. SRS16 TaxID=282217 RepID=UPI0013175ECF|nr:DotU family type IV/VI secretion system protein [Variovorax sp. SRS16]VTU31880.1 type IV/VI secretion system protein, DotU family [Variovorax sp. SRS16]
MARLVDRFSALFSFGLELDLAIAAGRAAGSCQAAQQRARALLDQARTAAAAAGTSPRQIESASFAMVAWIDEILARHPACTARNAPLQVQLFNSNNAHSEFFHHLSALQADDGEVREVYWYALVHGFKGQYYFESGDSGELGKLKTLHAQQLPVRPAALDTLAHERITPQPYDAPDPPGPRDPERRERALLRAGGALTLLVPLAWLLWWLLAGPGIAPPTLAQRVEQRLQTYACSDLSATTGADGALRVSGFVSLPEDKARVQREVGAMSGGRTAVFDLRLRIWPYCEVAAILKPYQARNRGSQYGLHVGTATARDGRLREGDTVLLQVTSPSYDAYLWVDYYTADGAVMHLSTHRPQRLAAGATIELGRDIPSSWLVSPPFGTVMVSALASPAPFDETADRPPFELASAFLLRLREALAANKGGDRLIADFVFFETVER